MTTKYAVMIECRSGYRDLIDNEWRERYHVIQWTVEDDAQEAAEVARQHLTNVREVRATWVEPVEVGPA